MAGLTALAAILGGVKAVPLSQLPAEAWRTIVGPSFDAGDLLDLYESVPWLRRAVDVRAAAIASMPFAFQSLGGEELPLGELPPLVPAPLTLNLDLPALLEQLEGWYVLFGAAYLYLRRNRFVPLGLRTLHPASIRPEYDKMGELVSFRRMVGSEAITFMPDELAYLWSPNRRHEQGPGAAPALAALAAAGVLKNGDAFAAHYFEQAPIAPTLVEMPMGTSSEEVERVNSWLAARVNGVRNAFKGMGVRAALKFNQLSMIEMGKLAMPELTDKKREDVATALGVPQSFLTSRTSTNATAEQDDFHFYDKTILPQCRRYEVLLNTVFRPLGYTIHFKEDQLELYKKLAAAQAVTRVVPLVQQRIITLDEARMEVGYEAMTPEQRDGLLPMPMTLPMLTAAGQGNNNSANTANGDNAGSEKTFSEIKSTGEHAADCPCAACKTARDPIGEARRADKKKFLAVALKRWDEGKFEKALDFTSEVMGAELDFIKGALESALKRGDMSRDDIQRVFARADAWEGYP